MFNDTLYLQKRDLLKTVLDYNAFLSAAYEASVTTGKARRVVSISIEDLRVGGVLHVQNILESVETGSVVLVNAVDRHDLDLFTLAALQAELDERLSPIYRSSDSFIASRTKWSSIK
jgi:signal-transduction protein with cAMP-binding, CBS, and nucleotidyltransferase domain